jgi:hypothetical protein
MLIISKFHDYYDSASAYGVDKEVIYKRVPEEIILKWHHGEQVWQAPDLSFKVKIPELYYRSSTQKGTNYYHHLVLGFCGSIHPLILKDTKGELPTCHWDNKGLSDYPKESFMRPERNLENFFNPTSWNNLLSLFQNLKVPVWGLASSTSNRWLGEDDLTKYVGRGGQVTLVKNPCLRKIDFMKVVPTNQTHQAIYSYISGVLGQQRDIPQPIDDKNMAQARGHDGKYSFKKPPGGGEWR